MAKSVRNSVSTSTGEVRHPSTALSVTPATTSGLQSADELSRWADLVAEGTVEFPQGLDARNQACLLKQVQARRRARLIQFIARAIASDMLRVRRD